MNIAFSVNSLLNEITGIQQYEDSLLNALYAVNTKHKLTAFASEFPTQLTVDHLAKAGLLQWRNRPDARFDTAGNDFTLRFQPSIGSMPVLQVWANRLDSRLVHPVKVRTKAIRTRRASRRYDLMHHPDVNYLECLDCAAPRNIATIHDMTIVTRAETHLPGTVAVWSRFSEYVKQNCARVLTVSNFSKADIIDILKIPAERIDVTPLAARSSTVRVTEPYVIAAALEPLGLADAPFVLYCGTLEPRKNLVRLCRAFAEATREPNLAHHRLVLAGGSRGTHREELAGEAQSLGIAGRLVMPGYLSNDAMNALMSACDVFAYVSEYEGFGLPPLEAMVCGAPIVASTATSLPEVMGPAGIGVDPIDVTAVAAGLYRLMTDREENRRQRCLSLERAGQFSWESTARLTLQSYDAALA